jgi:hypothetical protein
MRGGSELPYEPRTGDVVQTRFGRGVVKAIHESKVDYEVDDLPGRTLSCSLQVARDAFRPLNVLKKESSPVLRKSSDAGPTELLNAVDALRFGLVPSERIYDLSMHSRELERSFKGAIPYDGDKPTFRMNLVEGEWGQGKSHTKVWMMKKALDEGYLVANVEVDGVNVSFADTKMLLFEMLRTIKGTGLSSSEPILDLYTKAIKHGFTGPELYCGTVQRNMINYNAVKFLADMNYLQECDHIMEMLLTSSPDVAASDIKRVLKCDVCPLIGQKVADRPFDLMIALIAVVDIAVSQGFKGLFVTFDEWEVQGRSGIAWDRMKSQMEAMKFFFKDKRYNGQPISFIVFNVPSSDESEEDEDDNADIVDELVKISGGMSYRIPIIEAWDEGDEELRGLAKRIHSSYVKAYGISNPRDEAEYFHILDERMEDVDFLETGSTRMMLKMIVSVLDMVYGPPERKVIPQVA